MNYLKRSVIDRLIRLKERLKQDYQSLQENLSTLIERIESGDYIDPNELEHAIESIKQVLEGQALFYQDLEDSLPVIKQRNINEIEQLLEVEKEKINFFKIFERFLKLETIDPIGQQLLAEYQQKIDRLLRDNDVKVLKSLYPPYELFVSNVELKDFKHMTIEEDELLQKEFHMTLLRLLFTGKINFKEEQVEPIGKQEERSNEAKAQNGTPKHEKTSENNENSRYQFITKKSNRSFSANRFLSLIKSYSKAYSLRHLLILDFLANYGLVSREHLESTLNKIGEISIVEGALFNKFINEGYISIIKDLESETLFYCLSDNGIEIFKKQTTLTFFERFVQSCRKPSRLYSVSHFKNNPELISTLHELNDFDHLIWEIISDICYDDIDVKSLPVDMLLGDTLVQGIVSELNLEPYESFKLAVFHTRQLISIQSLYEQIKDLNLVLIIDHIDRMQVFEGRERKPIFVVQKDEEGLKIIDHEGHQHVLEELLPEYLLKSPTKPEDPKNDKPTATASDTQESEAEEEINERKPNDEQLTEEEEKDEITPESARSEIEQLVLDDRIPEALVFAKTLTYIPDENQNFIKLYTNDYFMRQIGDRRGCALYNFND